MINKNKPIKKTTKGKKIKDSKTKNNFGYLTQREVTNFKLKERVHLNSEIHLKSKNNLLSNIKRTNLKQIISFNEGNKVKKLLNNKAKENITSNNTVQTSKIDKINIKKKTNGKKSIKRKKINIIGKLYNKILYMKIK